MSTDSSRAIAAICFFVAFTFASNYTLNHFYVDGAYMLDSGWFSFLSAYAIEWPAQNPPALGGTYFSTHFSPVFYLLSIVYSIIYETGIALPPAVFFSLTQGLWFGLAAWAVYMLVAQDRAADSMRNKTVTVLVAVLAAFNGISLAAIGFPHFEIGIPALLFVFLALFLRGSRKLGYLALAAGLSMREDAGLHYFGALILLAGALWLTRKRDAEGNQAGTLLTIAVVCAGYSVAAIALQKSMFSTGDNALARVYLGVPPLEHINATFITGRLKFYLEDRIYIWLPLTLLAIWSWKRKDPLLAVGALAVVPWILFSGIAISPAAGSLTSYYAFPVVIAILWPAVAINVSRTRSRSQHGPVSLLGWAIVVLASIVGFPGSSALHDKKPWRSFGPTWLGEINRTESSLRTFLDAHGGTSGLLLDDAAASLTVDNVSPENWSDLMGPGGRNLRDINLVLFKPESWQADRVATVIVEAELNYLCPVGTSLYVSASREAISDNCAFAVRRSP